jgi:hypothetical protein
VNEEAPRGRLIYGHRNQAICFCCRQVHSSGPGVVKEFMSEMNLPESTSTDTDSHYRCAVCLSKGWSDTHVHHGEE